MSPLPPPQPNEAQVIQIADLNDQAMSEKLGLLTPQQRQQYEHALATRPQTHQPYRNIWNSLHLSEQQKAAMMQIDAQGTHRINDIMQNR